MGGLNFLKMFSPHAPLILVPKNCTRLIFKCLCAIKKKKKNLTKAWTFFLTSSWQIPAKVVLKNILLLFLAAIGKKELQRQSSRQLSKKAKRWSSWGKDFES